MNYLNLDLAYKISVSILLLSTFISALELISVPKLYVNFVFPKINMNNKRLNWVLIHLIQACLSILTFIFLIFSDFIYFQCFFIPLSLVTLYSYKKRETGKDGSDQLRILTFLSYSICFLLDKENGSLIALFFTGSQVIIAYTTSGLFKMFSKHWRKGDVLSGILSTYSYGVPKVSKLLINNPTIEKTVSYSAISTMLAVPLCFLLPFQTPLLIALTLMLFFHLSTAILMGLNDFLITFPLAYPGIIILHSFIFNY